MSDLSWITPEWPAPSNVRALCTTRIGGASHGRYAGLNLATHVEDDPAHVELNRRRLRDAAQLPAEPIWLQQVHGVEVWTGGEAPSPPVADAAVTHEAGRVCAILTADCLPVLLCNREGTVVAAAHAGWRGLVAGILDATINSMRAKPSTLLAWLGPAIEASAFEVGDEVQEQFIARDPRHATCFERNARGRWQADLYALARGELSRAGVDSVFGGHFATFADAHRFYSYRRDKQTGRMASLIWRS